MTAGAFVVGVAAYLYLKERHAADRPLYRKAIRVGAWSPWSPVSVSRSPATSRARS